jgi:glycogen(starch) synthase
VRILQVAWEYPPLVYGGLGRHVHALAESQAAAGHDVVVLTQQPPDAALDEILAGVQVIRVPYLPLVGELDDLIPWVSGFNEALILTGQSLRDRWQPEVVHAHDWTTATAGVLLAQFYSVPLVVTVHATEAGRHQGYLPTELSRSINEVELSFTHNASRIITCSTFMHDEVVRLFSVDPDQVDVIPNGIDLQHWYPPVSQGGTSHEQFAGDDRSIVYTGRLEYEKGVHTLLAAMPAILVGCPTARLVVAGAGSYDRELRELRMSLGLQRHVQFTGWLPEDELLALYTSADVIAVPSIYEPFGLVPLEAAALTTPVVVAAVGGLVETITDGATGTTFVSGDSAALAAAVLQVLGDPESAAKMAQAAYEQVVRDNNWTRISGLTIDTYAIALQPPGWLQPTSS